MKEEKDVWLDAINTNLTDGLEPSEFLKKLIEANQKGEITTEEMIKKLKEYYEENN